MADKKKYYNLDEIGFVGTQKKMPAIVRKQIEVKTGDAIRASKTTRKVKKAS
jgi:hypothetical protein